MDARPSDDPRSIALSLAFLVERVMDADELAGALHASADAVARAARGDVVRWRGDQALALDRIIATQSLLLDGYRPETMAVWMRTANDALGGETPADVMRTGEAGFARVLEAAVARMST